MQKIEKFTKEGSGWMIDKCNTLFLNIAKYEPLKDSSYIPPPEILPHKKAIINVKNQDQEYFNWALKSALFPAKNNLNKPYSYPKQDKLNMDGIDFPTPISQNNKIKRGKTVSPSTYMVMREQLSHIIYLGSQVKCRGSTCCFSMTRKAITIIVG